MNVLPRPPPPLTNIVPLHSISIMRRSVVPCSPVATAPRTSRTTRTTRNLVNYFINLHLRPPCSLDFLGSRYNAQLKELCGHND